MARKSLWARAVTLGVSVLALALSARAADRLDHFRELVAGRLAVDEGPAADEARREVWATVDDEVLENLSTGGLFASLAFVRDRLEQFSDAWGGASFRVSPAGELLVGVFELPGPPAQGSVRVYRAKGRRASVLLALERAARPTLRALPSTPAGAQFLVVWEGAPTARGSRPLSVDLVRQDGDSAHVTWSTSGSGSEPLRATGWSMSGAELRVRTELTYPGWAPGCAHQTEQEDVYRIPGLSGTVVRTASRLHDAWHRDARAVAARLFDALAAGDARTLTRLVPDARLRGRLPVLIAAPVCDAIVGRPGEGLLVGASEFDGRPWSLLLRRVPGGWRVAAATPVLE